MPITVVRVGRSCAQHYAIQPNYDTAKAVWVMSGFRGAFSLPSLWKATLLGVVEV